MSMKITVEVGCPDCEGNHVIRYGYLPSGVQRFRCRECGRAFIREQERRGGHDAEFKERVLAAYLERASMRGIARTFHISRNTLTAWLKEKGGSCRT
jgi:transposase-like protein